MDEARKNYIKQLLCEISLAIIVYIVPLTVIVGLNNIFMEFLFPKLIKNCVLIVGLFTFFHYFIFRKKNKLIMDEMNEKYYEKYIKEELNKHFSNVTFSSNKGLEMKEVYHASKIVSRKDLVLLNGRGYYSNNLISGEYKGVPFKQADVKIFDESSSHPYKEFSGQWTIIENKRRLLGDIYIRQNDNIIPEYLLGYKEIGYSKVELNSPEFDKKYSVFAQNPDEALNIISPSFMDKLVKIQDSCGFWLSIVICEGNVHIVSMTRKSFTDFKPLLKLNDEEETIKNQNRIKILIDIIDLFV